MRPNLRRTRQPRDKALLALLPVSIVLCLAGGAVAAELPTLVLPPKSPSGVVTLPPSAEADAETYAQCMKLARSDPHAALKLADAWRRGGGAHPADHCAAVALIGSGKYKEGATRLQALATAMAKAPAGLRAGVLDQAGQAWLLAGDPGRAYAAAGQAAALAPGDPEILIDRAEAAAAAGHLDHALDDLDRVLQKDPSRVDALIYRAAAYRALDRLDPARADIDKALSQAPHSPAALLERGNLRRLEGDREGARQDWEEVGTVAPGSPEDMAARANLEKLAKNPAATAPATPGKAAPQ